MYCCITQKKGKNIPVLEFMYYLKSKGKHQNKSVSVSWSKTLKGFRRLWALMFLVVIRMLQIQSVHDIQLRRNVKCGELLTRARSNLNVSCLLGIENAAQTAGCSHSLMRKKKWKQQRGRKEEQLMKKRQENPGGHGQVGLAGGSRRCEARQRWDAVIWSRHIGCRIWPSRSSGFQVTSAPQLICLPLFPSYARLFWSQPSQQFVCHTERGKKKSYLLLCLDISSTKFQSSISFKPELGHGTAFTVGWPTASLNYGYNYSRVGWVWKRQM